MKVTRFGRGALCVTSSAGLTALLAACSTHGNIGTLPEAGGFGGGSALVHSQTFVCTGHRQTFEVPAGVNALKVLAFAASGSVKATIPVTPGEKLAAFVGGAGATAGGFNGAGNGGSTKGSGGGAGGHVKSAQGAAPVGSGQIVISR